eukprot:scaffold112528_cov17-Tisochrysis_lutea.AAC.1
MESLWHKTINNLQQETRMQIAQQMEDKQMAEDDTRLHNSFESETLQQQKSSSARLQQRQRQEEEDAQMAAAAQGADSRK